MINYGYSIKISFHFSTKKNMVFFIKKILLTLKSKNYGFEKTKRPRIKHC